jgi:hypothetical protein
LLAGCVAAGALMVIEVRLPHNHSLNRTCSGRRATKKLLGHAG